MTCDIVHVCMLMLNDIRVFMQMKLCAVANHDANQHKLGVNRKADAFDRGHGF